MTEPVPIPDGAEPVKPPTVPPSPEKAPTLYLIIAFKLIKGILFISLAVTVYALSDNDLPSEYKHFLHKLNRWFNTERHFWVELATRIGSLTEAGMVRAALGTMIYSLFSLIEGVGLMLRIRWIGWLTILEAAFFIPLELYELVDNFHWIVLAIMVLNVVIVGYLYRNRERLFGHH